ncbi:hypothetical protein U9M48_009910, partial [Paspalum notatum var. saurae]
MVCSRSLVRVACCSLRGLVTYLRICFPMVSDEQAMRFLLLAELSLPGAAEMARGEGHDERSPPDLECAYMAAATHAQPPDPGLLVDFLVSTFPRMPLFSLTTMDFQQLHSMFIQYCSTTTHISSQEQEVPRDFREEDAFAVRKVTALLTKYMEQTNKEGAKIVHPDLKKYSGRDIMFEAMACMVLGGLIIDDDGDELIAACADICEEDCIYFDANRDARCVEFLNARD